MVVSQIEGYLAGIIICPDLIMPSEWLPLIWDTDSALHAAAQRSMRAV